MQPEEYWIGRGSDVIGTDVIADGRNARQAATYGRIAKHIQLRGLTDVLDIGCNICALYYFLGLMNWEGRYRGIDSNPYVVDRAFQNAQVDIGNLRLLPYADKHFQAVVVKDVIEHLESYELLAEAFRVCKDTLYISTYIPWTREKQAIVKHADGYYTNRYSVDDVINFAAKYSFWISFSVYTLETNGTINQTNIFERDE